ncbi:MAG: ABC transporter permease [Thermacetogeniaceae bacterium]|jgi:ABC-2 type transport system permease protein
MNRILAIIRKEFIQLIRDRLTLGFVLMLPVIQLLLFGYGIQTEVKHIPTAVFDQSLTTESRDLIDTFRNSGYFNMNYAATSFAGVTRLIGSGQAKVGIIFPPDFAKDLRRGGATVQVIVDASDNLVANQAVAAANSISQVKSLQVLVQKYGITDDQPYDIEVRPWYNPDGIAAYYMLPALLGMILSMMMMLQTAVSIVRERERGTMEQLLVTPIKSYELMIGKVVPNFVLGNVLVTISLLVASLIFHVPIRGSLLQLYLLTMFFITASLGMGIMISNFARNQMQAMQMTFFVLLPSMVLTGFVFPRAGMPKVIYYISTIFPVTFYFDIIRGVMLKGIGFRYLLGQVSALLVFSVIFMTIAILNFKKKIA